MGRPVDLLITKYAALPTRICLGDAGVHGKAFHLDQTCFHTATHHFIKQTAKQIAVPETAVLILGERRVTGDFILKAQPSEPAICQAQMSLIA